ncbi:MAG: hypothetical protein GX444_16120 [Myxococcales bacterium]|nr:hypothetical protein [Myxococcales bacterium]
MNWTTRLRDDPAFLRRAFAALLILAALARLYHLNAPLADRQSWNQVSAATVIRHFVEDGIDPWRTQWDVLIGDRTGPRIEQQEAPLYHVAVALLAKIWGHAEATGRLLNIAASLLTALFLFRLARREADGAAAWFAAAIFLFAPFGWFFSRTVMSDVWMLAMIVLGLERFALWLEDSRGRHLCEAALATLLAGLLKPFALHIGLAMLLLQLARRGWRSLLDWRLVAFAVVTVAVPVAWVVYAARVGSLGDVVTTDESWLTATRLWGKWSLLLSGGFWNRLQGRIFDQLATPLATALALVALLGGESRRQLRLAGAWLVAVLAYLLVVRDGNYMHDYYQLPFLPLIALTAGIGLGWLAKRAHPAWIALLLAGFLVWSALYVRTAFYLDWSSVRAGELVKSLSRPEDLIVSFDPGVTRKNQLIYAAHRRGWHIGAIDQHTAALYAKRGAKWLVACLEDEQLAKHPRWEDELRALPEVARESGPYGPRGERHTIVVYRLSPEKLP